jgi:phosphatidylserine/phosphatidylglycerophosphate/cardiolipin synthase-like enzyme
VRGSQLQAVGRPGEASGRRDTRDKLRTVLGGAVRLGDRFLGDAVEGTNLLYHRRRLSRLGHAGSFSPGHDGSLWAAGDPPPRTGNELDVLIDGEEALPAIARAIRSARSHVHIAGWSMTPRFQFDARR